jgi:uncharacterized protein YeaC (DUF1315 family)
MADYLDEDPVIQSQRFAVLSYVIPNEEDPKGKGLMSNATPMIKIRGSYPTITDCESRIKKLQKIDEVFNMYVVEIGKWGSLLTQEQVENNDEVEVVYREEFMNELIKGRKEQKENKDKAFQKRKDELKTRAEQEGTKEGQQKLLAQRENPVSVRDRLEKAQAMVKTLTEDLKEWTDVYEKAKEKFAEYTQEEIDAAELEIKSKALEIN